MTRTLKLWLLTTALLTAVAAVLGFMSAGGGKASPAAERPARAATPKRGPLGSGKPVVLAFGGDVHFEGVLATKLATAPSQVLAPIAPVLELADIAVVNLETAVTNGGSPSAKTFVFRTPSTAFAALRGGGIDVASMANNHGLDYGRPASATRSRRPGATASRSSGSAATTDRRTRRTGGQSTASASRSSARRRCSTTT